MFTEIENLVLEETGCGFCHVGPGQWCRTKSNRLASSLHSSRGWVAYQAYAIGYVEGSEDAR